MSEKKSVRKTRSCKTRSGSARIEPLEHDEQSALFQRVRYTDTVYPELALLFAIPNGTRTTPYIASKMKAEGVLKGVCDIFLPCARGGYHGLFIEMKRKSGTVSKEQKWFIEAVRQMGFKAEVCYSADEAWDELMGYLSQ